MPTLGADPLPWASVVLASGLNALIVLACFSIRRGKVFFGVMVVCFFTVLEFERVPGFPHSLIAFFEGFGAAAGIIVVVQHFMGKNQRRNTGK